MTKIVLCVDDSVTMQTVADITFRGTEYQYVGARTVEDALDKAKSTRPSLVLADAQMPGKNGYDLCMAMKTDGKLADVPVVILVGNGAPYDSNRGISVGADGSLPKPWDTQTMLEKVNEVVGRAGGGVAKPGQPSAASAAAAASQPVAQIPVAAAKSGHSTPAVAAAAGAMPPRSATIMGMPTIKMPAGVAAPANVQPAKTTVMAVPPVAASASTGNDRPLRPPAPVASIAAAAAPTPMAPIPAATTPGLGGMSRSPMVAGSPTKRSALVERTLAKMAARLAEAAGLEPGSPELVALLKLSTEVVERIVWEVVPDLAEQIIRENLHDLTARRS